MVRRLVTFCCAVALTASNGRGEDTIRLLPGKPEVKPTGSRLGEVQISIRGRDLSGFDFLMAISALDGVRVIVDDSAVEPLKSTLLTIDLRERPVLDVVDLIGAAASVDVEKEINTYRILGAPIPGVVVERAALRRSAQRMYEQALTQPGDATLTASALRGMAELHRLSGDLFTAYSLYETLLSEPYLRTPAAVNCELLLADCYAGIGNPARASKLLRNFVDRSDDPRATERAFRRLVTVLADLGRFGQIELLGASIAKLGRLQPETLKKIAEASAKMLKAGQQRSAALLLRDVWSVDPVNHATLGPVLALALVMNGDPASAEAVLTTSMPHLGSVSKEAAAMWAFAEIANATQRGPETIVFAVTAMNSEDAVPDLRRRCHILLANLYASIGIGDRARAHYYEAELLSAPPEAAALAIQSARMTLEEGRPDHARLLFQAAVEYGFDREEAEYGVAESLLRANEPKRAISQIRQLLRGELSDDLRERVRILTVDCLTAAGDHEAALRMLDGDSAVLDEKAR